MLYSVVLVSAAAAAAAKLLQSCPTLCDSIDGSPPGSSVPGILQARILEWLAIFFSNACMLSHFSHIRLCATLWTAAHQAPLSTGFSRQEYWSGLPCPSPCIVSAVQQNESDMHIHISPPFWTSFPFMSPQSIE